MTAVHPSAERTFHIGDIDALERFYRTALVNSLFGGKALVLVGTQNTEGSCNLAPFNSLVHVGANPPLVGLVFRPLTERVGQTWRNLEATGACTLNAVHGGMIKAAHACSAKFPPDVSEFDATGLTVLRSSAPSGEAFPAPFVAESRVRVACKLLESHAIRANGTRFAVLAVQSIVLPDAAVGGDGFVDPGVTGSLSAAGLDAYGQLGPLTRLPYAQTPGPAAGSAQKPVSPSSSASAEDR